MNIGRSTLIHEAGLPMSVVKDDIRITSAQFFALWHALETLGGPDIGLLLLEALDSSMLPPSILVAYYARNLGDALQRVARFKELCAPEKLDITNDGDYCVITTEWPLANKPAPAALTDATMASLVGMARQGTEQNFTPLRLDLRREKSDALADYFGCPIQWKAPQDRLLLRLDDLDLRFATYNRELVVMLDTALGNEIEQRQATVSFSGQVRWLLRHALTAGRPELRSIARELAISERSLQRRLNEEGQSFQSLLSDTRHQLACEYLTNPTFEIIEIAYMLGFEDQGSFYRAFQKWETLTPSEWRKAHISQEGP
ncbi:MAG: helix-turn-helix domain-containing protein [Rhodospirillales bacterium]|nr:helix-turn-helix domain-containing protein [Rhodospirillales bacterium]